MNSAENHWYVFYTRFNAEKAVCNELLKRQYEAWLPLTRTMCHWGNRQKKYVTRPLFRSYVFVKTHEAEIYNIVKVRGIVRCVRCGEHFSIMSDRDIICIEQMLNLGQQIFAEHDFSDGERVRVIRGPLAGYEGLLIKRKGKTRLGIVLDDIHQCACIDIDVAMLEKV